MCYYSLEMDTRSLAIDINGLLPIIVLILFLVIPYVLKTLGRYSSAGKNAEPPEEHDIHGEQPMPDEPPGPPLRHDYDRVDRSTPSSRPINPKWF